MTGLEIMAVASALQAGGKMIKGGLDWLDGGKASKEELARLKTLRERLNAEAVTDADVQRAEQYGSRQATSTMGQARDNARQQLAFQGLGSSGLASQVGLKEAQIFLWKVYEKNASSTVVGVSKVSELNGNLMILNFLEHPRF